MKLRIIIAVVLSSILGVPAFSQYVTITHTNIVDESGTVLASGLECFTPVNNLGTPITATFSGATSGTIVKQPKCYAVTNGTLAGGVRLVGSNHTNPLNLCYLMTLRNSSNNALIIGPNDGYGCIQPVDTYSTTLELNTLGPNIPGLVLLSTTGPPGPPGPTGSAGTAMTISTITANTTGTAVAYDQLIRCNGASSSSSIIYTLPTSPSTGQRFYIKNVGLGTCIVAASNIDGHTSVAIFYSSSQQSSISVAYDPTSSTWNIF